MADTSKKMRNLLKTCSNTSNFAALDTLASMATSSSNSSIRMAVCVTPTTRTTAMTVLSVKRVSERFALANTLLMFAVDEVWVGPLVVRELKRIVESSEITKWDIGFLLEHLVWHLRSHREDDSNWPKKNIVGKQELEIRVGSDHIAFEVCPLHQAFFLRLMDTFMWRRRK